VIIKLQTQTNQVKLPSNKLPTTVLHNFGVVHKLSNSLLKSFRVVNKLQHKHSPKHASSVGVSPNSQSILIGFGFVS